MYGIIPWQKENPSRLESWRPFQALRREFDSLFDQFFGRSMLPESDWPNQENWGLDVRDTGAQIVVRAEAPGFDVKDFDVQFTDGMLTIQAEHKEEGTDENAEQHWMRFSRSIMLPTGVDAEKVEARYTNGILEVKVAKSPEALPKRIEVKS